MEIETLVAIMALVFCFVVGFLVGYSIVSTRYEQMMGELKQLMLKSLPISIPQMRDELKQMMNPEDAKLWIGNPDDDGTLKDVARFTKEQWNVFVDDLNEADTIKFYTQYIKLMEDNGRKDD